MSNFRCTCGHIISDVVGPNEVTGDILSDKSGDIFFDSVASVIDDFFAHFQTDRLSEWRTKHFNDLYPKDLSPGVMLHDALHSIYLGLRLAMMECDQCGRLWIQKAVGVNEYIAYSFDGSSNRPKLLGLNQSPESEQTLSSFSAGPTPTPVSPPYAQTLSEHQKGAYRHLLYWAMVDIRNKCQSRGEESNNPLEWRKQYRQSRAAGAIADWLHNLAYIAANNFLGFDEQRFWKEHEGMIRKFPDFGFKQYRSVYESRLSELAKGKR